jgi:hypothetical protein
MEPDGLLSYSEEPSTSPYPELDESKESVQVRAIV